MPAVIGVPVPVVHVVDVIPMWHGNVPAPLAVLMSMAVMSGVPLDLALVDVIAVHAMQMPVVRIVDVIVVRHGNMPATGTVLMGVLGMGRMRNGTQSGLRPLVGPRSTTTTPPLSRSVAIRVARAERG